MQLLEDHLKQLREEDGVGSGDDDDDDESAWNGWDVESDSSSESSDGWIDVQSEGDDDLEVSDSEDEREKPTADKADAALADDNVNGDGSSRISSLATTKVCSQCAPISQFY